MSRSDDKPQKAGDLCRLCGRHRLIAVKRAIVCPRCDNAAAWPNVKGTT
jgi:hypothetical protein